MGVQNETWGRVRIARLSVRWGLHFVEAGMSYPKPGIAIGLLGLGGAAAMRECSAGSGGRTG